MHNLCQIIIQLSNKFKNPYCQQIPKKELKTVENPLKLNVDIENYLLQKPREGRAFLPRGTTNVKTFKDLSFIPIEKTIIEKQNMFKQDEEIIEKSISTALFSIDTRPLDDEDIGISIERETKSFIKPVRYYGLKMKKRKPNSNRKGIKENANTKEK